MISRIYLAALLTCMVSLVLAARGKNKNNKDLCKKFGMDPYFHPKMILGPQWRIYYTWNPKNKINCLAMKFYSVNPSIVNRFRKDMGQYLMKQPFWNAPMFYMTIGAAKDQILFFADRGPPGRVQGVPYVIRDPIFMIYKRKKSVPLMHIQMKFLQGGQYLVLMDCVGGTVTLSTRDSQDPPYRADIEEVARKLDIGNGSLACSSVRKNSDGIVIPPPDYDIK